MHGKVFLQSSWRQKAEATFIINGGNFSTTTFSANTTIYLQSGMLNSNLSWYGPRPVRGGLTVQVPVTSSNTNVGTITESPVAFTGGSSYQMTTAFHPVTVGTSTISVGTPTGFSTPTSYQSITATVTK